MTTGGPLHPSQRKFFITIFCQLIGIAVASYAGQYLVFPLLGSGLTWWLGKKRLAQEKQQHLPAIAVQTGYLAWLIIAFVAARQLNSNLIDILLLSIGLWWLFSKPGIKPIILLGLYQILGISANLIAFLAMPFNTLPHKVLLIHIIWRAMALFFMGSSYLTLRKTIHTPPATPPHDNESTQKTTDE